MDDKFARTVNIIYVYDTYIISSHHLDQGVSRVWDILLLLYPSHSNVSFYCTSLYNPCLTVVFSSCFTAWVLNLGDSVSWSWGPLFEWTKHGHPTVAARNLAPPGMYETKWKHIKTHKKVGYTVEPIHWCRISSNNMARATLNCITWTALRTAGVNRGETPQRSNSSRLKFQYFSVTNSRLQSECHQLPVIQNFQELQVTAATLHHFAWLRHTKALPMPTTQPPKHPWRKPLRKSPSLRSEINRWLRIP